MKKILSIALIAALVLSSAFAGFKEGSATIDLGYNLDSKDYGFANGAAVKYNFGFELGSEDKAKAGEGDLRAEIAASFKAEFAASDYTGKADLAAKVTKLEITKADILYKDILKVSILGAGKSSTYATAYYAVDETKPVGATNPLVNKIDGVSGVAGFEFKAYDVTGGFGLTGNSDAETYKVLAHAATAVKAGDVAVDVAAGTLLTDADKTFVAAAKAAFEKDKLSAKAALDFQYKAEEAGVEFATNAKYDFVTADVYFVSLDSFDTVKLDAKLAAEKAINETVTKVKGYVDARDLTDEDLREVAIGAEGQVVVAPVTIDATASYKVKAEEATVMGKATYKADTFEAYAKLTVGMAFADEFKATKIAPEVGVSSEAVINGAKVSLKWTGADLAEDVEKKGKIAAQVSIAL